MSYSFPAASNFVNRVDDLAAMDRWWSGDDRNSLNLYGRRRVGKSWLFRRFAHEKPATILVAERLAPGAQLTRLAVQLQTPLHGVRPDIADAAELFRLIYRLGARDRQLVVLDEFPYLLPRADGAREQVLTSIQAVMEEERDRSQTKLILCGSHVSQMQSLMNEASALRGRLTTLRVDPMGFSEALGLIEDTDVERQIERYAVTGGMARYLSELGSGGTLKKLVSTRLLDHHGALFNDPREVLEHELQQVAVYFSIMQELAAGERALGEIAGALKMKATSLPRPLETLRDMKLVERRAPISAQPGDKDSRYRILDPFLRFWFRFVFPYQEDLSSGLQSAQLYDAEIAPCLADHVSPVFEALCRVWTRRNRGEKASRVGSWWGTTTPHGRANERQTEEIDIVGAGRGRATLVGECKWTTKPLSVSILASLATYKIPALRQDMKIAADIETILFSRSGFTDGLRRAADDDPALTLVDLNELALGL